MNDLPEVKLKTVVNFPAKVIGGTAIGIEKAAGQYTIRTDYSNIQEVANLTSDEVRDSRNLVWNKVTNSFVIAPYALSATAGVASIDGNTGALEIGNGLAFNGSTLYAFAYTYDTLALASAATINATILSLWTSGYYNAGDGGGIIYKRVTADPGHVVSFRSQDRFLPNGSVSAGNGGWWEGVPYGGRYDIRYGGAKDGGVFDNRAIFRSMSLLAKGKTFYVPGTDTSWYVSGDVEMYSGTTYIGDGNRSVIKSGNPLTSVFAAGSQDGVRVHGLKWIYSASGTPTGYIGAVAFVNCSNVAVTDCEVADFSGHGILFFNTPDAVAERNSIHDHIGTGEFSGDIGVYNQSHRAVVRKNRCFGGASCLFGIIVQDADAASAPYDPSIMFNDVGTHSNYGIVVYQQGSNPQNTYPKIAYNTVDDITGLAPNYDGGGLRQGGTGIYVVLAGGAMVFKNITRNCCQHTESANLGAAGIAVTQDNLGALKPAMVSHNEVEQAHWHGIVGSGTEIIIDHNTVTVTGSALVAILGVASNNTAIDTNRIIIEDTSAATGIQAKAVLVAAVGDIKGIALEGNILTGGTGIGILTNVVGGAYTISGSISDNQVKGAGANFTAMNLQSLAQATINGNIVGSSKDAIILTGSTGVRGSSNILAASRYAITTAGTNSDNYFDDTNSFSNPASINNAVTGTIIDLRVTAIPSTGTHQVGSRARNITPAVSSPKAYLCTVAGSPGTWVSEGNL